MSHKITYQILNKHQTDGVEHFRDVAVHATPEELAAFDREGYLLRERLFQGEALAALQDATDRLFESEVDISKRKVSERSWGSVLRYLEYKDPIFLELIQHEHILSISRAMMGPLVRLRGLSARISWPGEEVQATPYHQHLRLNSVPKPPWFSDPHAIDALIYLDDLNDDTGTVGVVPGSHKWVDKEPPSKHWEHLDSEIEFRVPAGSAVLIHGNLWHRALPTVSAKRRMLILSYTPTWLRRSPHGTPPDDDFLRDVIANASDELRELLGLAGHS